MIKFTEARMVKYVIYVCYTSTHTHAEGRDALIVACEDDDRYVVVAGTFEKLVEQLACEEKPGQ